MSTSGGPEIVTDGLVLSLDAANKKSYPGTGTTWYDLSGNNSDFTLDGSGITYNSNGYFDLTDGGATYNAALTSGTSCTVIFWMKTTDIQSLFLSSTTNGGKYLGAYNSGNKEYYNTVGSPDFRMDLVSQTNIYDNALDGEWHMFEFKGADLSTWNPIYFNQYPTFTFGNGQIGIIQLYNKNLSASESAQNYNALKNRFGL